MNLDDYRTAREGLDRMLDDLRPEDTLALLESAVDEAARRAVKAKRPDHVKGLVRIARAVRFGMAELRGV